MRVKRQKRKEALLRAGLLPGEAQALSELKKLPPYFTQFLASRRGLFAQAKRLGWSDTKYRAHIKEIYRKEGCLIPDAPRFNQIDPWAMLRKLEDRYKDYSPQYETPTSKKQGTVRDFEYGAWLRQRRKNRRDKNFNRASGG